MDSIPTASTERRCFPATSTPWWFARRARALGGRVAADRRGVVDVAEVLRRRLPGPVLRVAAAAARQAVPEVGVVEGTELGGVVGTEVGVVVGTPDGDAVVYITTFLVDGDVAQTAELDTLASDRFEKGQTVSCLMVANDGLANSDPASSESVTIANSPPEVSAAAIDPESPTITDSLTCSHTFSDPDFDPDQSTVIWSINEIFAGTGPILASGYRSGDTVECAIEANDGEEDGNTISTAVTIDNSLPQLSTVWLTPTAADVRDTLTCTPGAVSDVDGDDVTLSYAWDVDGTALAETEDTLSPAFFDAGSVVTCSVTPADPTGPGAAQSAAVSSGARGSSTAPPAMSTLRGLASAASALTAPSTVSQVVAAPCRSPCCWSWCWWKRTHSLRGSSCQTRQRLRPSSWRTKASMSS